MNLKRLFGRSEEDFSQIMQHYQHPTLDPDAAAWQEVLNHKNFTHGKIIVVDVARLKKEPGAKAAYDSYLQKLLPAIKEAGGEVLKTCDILMTGIGDLEDYDYAGGTANLVQYPSRAAYLRALLSPAALEAHEERIAALDEALLMIVKDMLPPLPPMMTRERPASDFATPRVSGKTPERIVEELLSHYPDGGADPSRAQLETMTHYNGFFTTPVHYINLYTFNTAPQDDTQLHGEQAHEAYNRNALSIVRSHGARPYFRAQVQHNLLGTIAWDLMVFVRWPSFAVFTDLRLDPDYIEAQKYRVQSGQVYGNFVTIARTDAYYNEKA